MRELLGTISFKSSQIRHRLDIEFMLFDRLCYLRTSHSLHRSWFDRRLVHTQGTKTPLGNTHLLTTWEKRSQSPIWTSFMRLDFPTLQLGQVFVHEFKLKTYINKSSPWFDIWVQSQSLSWKIKSSLVLSHNSLRPPQLPQTPAKSKPRWIYRPH